MDSFEGPEKKVEVVVGDGFPSLRELPRSFWELVVSNARATILSELRGTSIDAYLLSESSLFVSNDRVTLLTCGQTRLVDAARTIIDKVGVENIALLIYERKNEHLPHFQETTFFEDAKKLNAVCPGKAVQFGAEHSHCIRLFHSTRPFTPPVSDTTIEVLMHGIDRKIATMFSSNTDPTRELGLDQVLAGFKIDSHLFSPSGYSLNAVNGDEYYTFHVTPEEFGSYVSFESNHRGANNYLPLAQKVARIFSPQSFDILSFNTKQPSGRAAKEPIRRPRLPYSSTNRRFCLWLFSTIFPLLAKIR